MVAVLSGTGTTTAEARLHLALAASTPSNIWRSTALAVVVR